MGLGSVSFCQNKCSSRHPSRSPKSVVKHSHRHGTSESRAFIIVQLLYKAVVYRRHTSHSPQNAQIHATMHTAHPRPLRFPLRAALASRRMPHSVAPPLCRGCISFVYCTISPSPSPEPRHCASASLQSAVRTSQTPGPSAHPEPARTPPPAPHPTRAQGCALITIVWPRPRCPKR